ncbi:MAG: 4-amino-4-deoxy-L-arabinose transferase, partial [Gammaproteobacteria bacterium]|nr:4-amino-4-deoxy-L-arabinose transferase [Gammaproteobacteria bacterium]
LNVTAQLLLKQGSLRISHLSLSNSHLVSMSFQLLSSPFILFGLLCYAISVVLWIIVLSRLPVSVAYPLTSLGYVLNALGAYYFFGEDLTLTRLLGILIIVGGVYLVARS